MFSEESQESANRKIGMDMSSLLKFDSFDNKEIFQDENFLKKKGLKKAEYEKINDYLYVLTVNGDFGVVKNILFGDNENF